MRSDLSVLLVVSEKVDLQFLVSCFAKCPCCSTVLRFSFVRRCWKLLIRSHKIGDETCSWSGCGTSHYFLIYSCTWLGVFILATVWCECPGQPKPGTRPTGSGTQKESAPACRLTANRLLFTCSCGTYTEHMSMWVTNSHERYKRFEKQVWFWKCGRRKEQRE